VQLKIKNYNLILNFKQSNVIGIFKIFIHKAYISNTLFIYIIKIHGIRLKINKYFQA